MRLAFRVINVLCGSAVGFAVYQHRYGTAAAIAVFLMLDCADRVYFEIGSHK